MLNHASDRAHKEPGGHLFGDGVFSVRKRFTTRGARAGGRALVYSRQVHLILGVSTELKSQNTMPANGRGDHFNVRLMEAGTRALSSGTGDLGPGT